MITQILPIDQESLALAKKLINNGELVAFPTETVYGLGANAFDEQAVKRTYVAKGRPSDNPLIVHVCNRQMIDMIACDISADAETMISAFMPGSLTIVLKKKACIPDCVTAGLHTVAVRMPRSIEARRFIEACAVPISAPSANLSTRPSPTTYKDVYEDLNGRIPLILAGEDCAVGIESTVLDLSGDSPIVLRPGIVTPHEIGQVLGRPVKVLTDPKSKVNSPGIRYKHYSPSCPVALDLNEDVAKVAAFYDELIVKGEKPVILCLSKHISNYANRATESLGDNAKDVAQRIFVLLRSCEKKYTYIIESFKPLDETGSSVIERMTRSAGGNIL